jgi:hypothetical protein
MSPSDTISSESAKTLGPEELSSVTQTPIRRLKTLEFAGFLTREDQDTIHIADPQVTWVIQCSDVLALEEWKVQAAPEFMSGSGRPVRVAIKDGATIQEIGPWQIRRGELGSEARTIRQKVFTLGGAPLPISERSVLGEFQLKELERHFARRIGWLRDRLGSTTTRVCLLPEPNPKKTEQSL